jgi:hypothetical protein
MQMQSDSLRSSQRPCPIMRNVLIRSSSGQSKRLLLSSSGIKAAVAGRNLLGDSYLGGNEGDTPVAGGRPGRGCGAADLYVRGTALMPFDID